MEFDFMSLFPILASPEIKRQRRKAMNALTQRVLDRSMALLTIAPDSERSKHR
jgi:hypothetical protein